MKESYAKELLKSVINDKKQDRIVFMIVWIITLLALIFVCYKYIELKNDIGVIETTTTQEVTQDNTNGDNNFIGNDGDINYGKSKD